MSGVPAERVQKSRAWCRRPRRWPHPCVACSGFCCGKGGYRAGLRSTVPTVARSGRRQAPRAWTRRRSHCYWPAVTDERRWAAGLCRAAAIRAIGLHAGQVAALTLDDVDWRAGELLVRAGERLPVGADVRPARRCRRRPGRLPARVADPAVRLARCSLRSLAPAAGRPGEPGDVLGGASRLPGRPAWPIRSSSAPPPLGHECCTPVLRCRRSGRVLRQRSLSTTAIYAKIDRAGLAVVSRPWPGWPRLVGAAPMGGGVPGAAAGARLRALQGQLLLQFVDYTESQGTDRLSTDLAVAWARQPVGTNPAWCGTRRLWVVRGFAHYLHTIDADCNVSSGDILPPLPPGGALPVLRGGDRRLVAAASTAGARVAGGDL